MSTDHDTHVRKSLSASHMVDAQDSTSQNGPEATLQQPSGQKDLNPEAAHEFVQDVLSREQRHSLSSAVASVMGEAIANVIRRAHRDPVFSPIKEEVQHSPAPTHSIERDNPSQITSGKSSTASSPPQPTNAKPVYLTTAAKNLLDAAGWSGSSGEASYRFPYSSGIIAAVALACSGSPDRLFVETLKLAEAAQEAHNLMITVMKEKEQQDHVIHELERRNETLERRLYEANSRIERLQEMSTLGSSATPAVQQRKGNVKPTPETSHSVPVRMDTTASVHVDAERTRSRYTGEMSEDLKRAIQGRPSRLHSRNVAASPPPPPMATTPKRVGTIELASHTIGDNISGATATERAKQRIREKNRAALQASPSIARRLLEKKQAGGDSHSDTPDTSKTPEIKMGMHHSLQHSASERAPMRSSASTHHQRRVQDDVADGADWVFTDVLSESEFGMTHISPTRVVRMLSRRETPA